MKNTKLFSKTLLATCLAVGSFNAYSAAFQIVESSTSGLGRAYAGDAATAENASVVAINPALMSLFHSPEISAGAIYIRPSVDLKGKITVLPANIIDAGHKNIAPNAIVPNLYAVYPVNEQFAIGGGMNVNYGLATEFNKNYSAGFYAGKTDLKSINLNLSGSYRLSHGFSLGLGLNAVYADALIVRHLGAIAKLPIPSPIVNPQDANKNLTYAQLNGMGKINETTLASRLKGKKWGFGWNTGLVYEFNENNRIGIAYRSPVDIKFKGTYSNSTASQPGRLTLNLPSTWEISGYHKLTDKFAMHYSYKITEWKRFKELKATDNNGKELFKKSEKFTNASRIALGATYDVSDKLTLRGGIAYDETPVQNPYFSISIPDTDRTWYSLGATYHVTKNLSTDVAFAYLKGRTNTFVEKDNDTQKLPSATFTAKSTASLYGLNINYRF